jgi:hypothetical protein
MSENNTVNSIANGFNAARKIYKIKNTSVRNDYSTTVNQSIVSYVIEALQVICDYSPENGKQFLREVINKSNLYNNTYLGLRDHVYDTYNQKITVKNLARTLEIIHPVLQNRNKLIVEKILKIYEIINS